MIKRVLFLTVGILSLMLAACETKAINNGKKENKMKTIELTKADFLKKIVDYEKNPEEWIYLGDKPAIIDFYASWCGPCKHMADNIFPLPKVGEYYNTYFLNLQLDAEKSEDGKMVAKSFGVSAYPTFLFVNGDGELVYRFLGGKSEDMFIKEGEKAVEAFAALPELKKYTKEYEVINALCDFSPFGAPQVNGQNALLLGKGTVLAKKKVRHDCSELHIVL